MNDSPKFTFDFSLVNANKKKADHFEASLKIKAKQLFQKIEEMKMKNEPTFSFKLFENYPDKSEEIIPDLTILRASYMMHQKQGKTWNLPGQ